MSHTLETKKFIESGLLESYAMGLATREEKEYIEERISTNPEISDYLAEIETGIQKFFSGGSTPPPGEVREIIQLRTTKTDVQKEKHVFKRTPREETTGKSEYLDIEVNDTYIKVHKYWRPAFIAVFVLSKIFLIAGLYYYFKTTNLEQEVDRLKTEINLKK